MREQQNLEQNPILSAFVKYKEIAKYEASGYFIPMIKIANISEFPDLPVQERKCLRILIRGHETKDIASKMQIRAWFILLNLDWHVSHK